MRGGGGVRAGAVGAGVLVVAGALSPAAAQETKSKRVVLTLRDAVKTAVARSPEMKSTAFDVEAPLGQKQPADAPPRPPPPPPPPRRREGRGGPESGDEAPRLRRGSAARQEAAGRRRALPSAHLPRHH